MVFFLISMVVIIALLLLINDIVFNKHRDKVLKFIEIGLSICLVIFLFINMSNNIKKKSLKDYVPELEVLDETVTEYNIDGTVKSTQSIGDYLKKNFVSDIFNASTNVSEEDYFFNNLVIVGVAVIFLIYWFVLLFVFEKEDESNYIPIGDEQLFEKYNPLMAACISQNRNIMCRDVVAVILQLINKKKLNLRIVPLSDTSNIKYKYIISENTQSTYQMDSIEREIFNWIFEERHNFENGIMNYDYMLKSENGTFEIDLAKRIKEIGESSISYHKLQELNSHAQNKLNEIGANRRSVPFWILMVNNLFMIVSVIMVTNHVINNGLSITINSSQLFYAILIAILAIVILPLLYILSIVIIGLIRNIFKTLSQVTEGATGRKIIAKIVSVVFATIIIMIVYASFASDSYILYDIALLGITFLIISTDDFMLKHDDSILNDYYNLKHLENKIKDYSLMKDENIEYIELWENYYAYSVAFGVPLPVNASIDSIYEDTSILTKPVLDNIYYVCKSYLEVMWEMDFSEKKSNRNFFEIYLKNL